MSRPARAARGMCACDDGAGTVEGAEAHDIESRP